LLIKTKLYKHLRLYTIYMWFSQYYFGGEILNWLQ